MPPMTYLVIAAWISAAGTPSDTPQYYAFKDPRACARDIAEVSPPIIAWAKRKNIRVKVSCEHDPRFGANSFGSIVGLKNVLRGMP